MPKRSETKPWERQDKEGEKPFEAFVIYRDMGEKRTLQAVADKLRKSYTLIRRWKDTWAWEDRVRAYDNNLQKEAHAEAVKKARKMADRHIGIALKLQAKAMEALEKMDAEDIDPKNLVAFIREATKLERENRQDIVRMTDPDRGEEGGSTSLADVISEAWERRRKQNENDS